MNHAEKFLQYVFTPTDIVEMRIALSTGEWMPGRFTDLNSMANAAMNLTDDADFAAIYFCLNPIAPANAKRVGGWSANELKRGARSTRDQDVLYRTLYLIDLDPVRPSGVCSTAEEKADALTVADLVKAHLTERGWPAPITVDSGNGYHLYFRGDHCNASSKAWTHVLKHLAALFNTATVKVDTAVANAARISRLPGTINRKGENTPERPHRRCKVLSYPETWTALPHHLIYHLACEGGFEKVERKMAELDGDRPELVDDVHEAIEAFVAEYPDQMEIMTTFEKDGVTYFALRECPLVGRSHTGAIGKSCITLSDTGVGYSCFSDECAGKGMRGLREELEKVTGRRSQVRFYTGSGLSPEERFDRWLTDYWKQREHAVSFRDDVYYDAESHAMLDAGAATTTDPDAYGLTLDDIKPMFFRWARRVEFDLGPEITQERRLHGRNVLAAAQAQDRRRMAQLMGAEELFMVHREKHRPGGPPPPDPPTARRLKMRLTLCRMAEILHGEPAPVARRLTMARCHEIMHEMAALHAVSAGPEGGKR